MLNPQWEDLIRLRVETENVAYTKHNKVVFRSELY